MDLYPYTLCDNCLISNPASVGKLPGTKNQEVYVSTARLDQVVNALVLRLNRDRNALSIVHYSVVIV